ncbi:hypothetical protein J7K28_01375 [Candidatus Aerophobetes bacterium]|nr:hypothetical protein [Candidatus Aerophobetes bacterium]
MKEEIAIREMLNWPLFSLIKQKLLTKLFYQSLLASFEIDLSSVYPRFEPVTITSSVEEFYEEILPEETLEHDIIVRMPPVKQYIIEVKIKSVEKAIPRIVEPEGL